jgi:hypothetical protein
MTILIMYILCYVWKLIYVTSCTRTKYVHQRLTNFQHVLTHHHGVLSVHSTVLLICVCMCVHVCGCVQWTVVRALGYLLTGLPGDGTCDVLKHAADCLTCGEHSL